ncbi:anthranilate phosphoribosyltransferase [Nesterenkonia jeotgali]|uniref:Anthranilate phosphoribosyltransferase n=1 Tax=Nesterenkonia jeotgali TaxID=317018 RepID=A0A0W8IDW8_9MICC|nr:anthranilate phosphoribosyltransferase [Nesterenkonia jeotgali]KUG58113.1 anthranilate phosphoribosyltransferase [Nesterenkonia jeotgali]MBA8920910.1 anthranilate phosphoribosyltransferase [Nesterenkonia jeotgali]
MNPQNTAAALPRATPLPASWPELLETLLGGEHLPSETSAWAMEQLMSGSLSDGQIAAFLVALRAKGEVAEELIGLSATMLDKAVPLSIPGPTLDIVGTGGDMLGTVNISTMASLTAVGAGARVVKHGNRGASSTAGAADVIEALGVDLSMSTQDVARAAEEVGITFLFAQSFHPAMRHVGPVRRQLGIRTVFNFLGPLSNPARVTAQALGCASPTLAPRMAEVLALRGTRGLVFRGRDGRDKITTSAATDLWEVRSGEVTHTVLEPEEVGLPRVAVQDLRGGSGTQNAQIVQRMLSGEPGPVRDAVVLNAAAGLTSLDEQAEGPLVDRLASNMRRAEESIDSGAAAEVLRRWVAFSRSVS